LSMLDKYQEKRDFDRTPEPVPGPAPASGPLRFVVQKHAARSLHYDFRLEVGGVLKSWAVPKGPSTNPTDKHLAVMVEDHPFEYRTFEGVIPAGEYGGGQVIVWDEGDYSPDESGRLLFEGRAGAEQRMAAGLAAGKLSFTLHGHKLRGSWTLFKMKGRGENNWLLMKHRDEFADTQKDILAEDASVRSGLTIEDLKAGRLPRAELTSQPVLVVADVKGARQALLPVTVSPMLASLGGAPFSHPDWTFEPKLDGIRAIAIGDQGKVRLFSRNGLDITAQYPGVSAALASLPGTYVIDGEIVALDANGNPSFQKLQERLNLSRTSDISRAETEVPVVFYIFDLLYLDGYDLQMSPLEERQRLLHSLPVSGLHLRLVEGFPAEGEVVYQQAVAQGLEGVVAKRRDSVYEAGRRSPNWLKIKSTHSDEFVIGGYTTGNGVRSGAFGALLLGYYDNDRLVYAGNVGTGFDQRLLNELKERLDRLATDISPFTDLPPPDGVTWVRPEMVAEVKYAEWTKDGRLRAPVFLRLRPEKTAFDVRLQQPHPQPISVNGDGSPLQTTTPPPSPPMDTAEGSEVGAIIAQLERPGDALALRVGRFSLPLTHLSKPLWPEHQGSRVLTKRDLLAYLATVSPYLLPHLRGRPLTLTRYPNGIAGERFYQRHWEGPSPEFLEQVTIFSEHEGDRPYLLCNNLATLLWLGQLADLELHAWASRVEAGDEPLGQVFAGSAAAIDTSTLNYPDYLLFDLDPYVYSGLEAAGDEPELNRAGFSATCQVAIWLKEMLDSLSLPAFVKTSGKTGLHIFVPVQRQFNYDTIRAASETIAKYLVQAHPSEVTIEWRTQKRIGKVFIDYNQNSRSKTVAAIYSPRPTLQATVSTPLRWEELKEVYPTEFTIWNTPARLATVGDLWSGILNSRGDLAASLGMSAGKS
jgi:bifunctional non-homologous end joining protein LigD